ncbi:MAG: MmgE/PrpD family protein [Alphaproteobacteria bacterium]|nr:MmgE/PrpD family protein [Alphaproteobacteria bacterium]
MTVTAEFGHFASSLRWRAISPQLQDKVKDHILDTVGVICAGRTDESSKVVEAVAQDHGGSATATVIGRSEGAASHAAAFVNAFHGRIHTFDDTHEAGPTHPGSAVVSAALAAAEINGASGERFLTAVLAGYEVAVRLSDATSPDHYAKGFHTTGTINTFGAGTAAAGAMDLPASDVAHAIALAGEGAAGLRAYQTDGGLSDSALNGARAALWGVVSAQLAAGGLAGPPTLIEGPWGFCRTMAPNADLAALTDRLGEDFRFLATSLKPYASCRFTHGPIKAVLALQERHGIAPEAVRAVEIATFRQSIDVSDKPTITTRTDAILSHQFAVARALTVGTVALDAFDEPELRSPAVHRLAQRVSVTHDPALEKLYPAKWPHRITIRLDDGREVRELSEHPPGSPEDPLDHATVRRKFDTLAAAALGAGKAQNVYAAVRDLESIPNIAELTQHLKAVTG